MKHPTTYRAAKTSSRADLGYIRNRDAGRCRVGRFTAAHVAVLDPLGKLNIEVLTSVIPPRWYTISPRMRPNEIEKAIRKSPDISPTLKTTYLGLIDAAKGIEVTHG